MNKKLNQQLVVIGYIDAIIFTEEDEIGNDPDFSFEALNGVMSEVIKFFDAVDFEIINFQRKQNEWSFEEQIGYDLWLTRNGHGVGFWDRPEIYGEENSEKLTKISQQMGEKWAYLGDNNLVYID